MKKVYRETYLDRLSNIRSNVLTVLRYGNVTPFIWNTRGYRCFYCSKQMRDCEILKEHTVATHKSVDLDAFIPKKIMSKNIPVKIDVLNLSCKYCPDTPICNFDDLISHIIDAHGESYNRTAGVCFFPFILNKDVMHCILCDVQYDNFMCLIGHMYKEHITHTFICQTCGLSFINQVRLKRHISSCHVEHRCSLCGKTFNAPNGLRKHKEIIHGQIKVHECGLCSTTFNTDYQLKVHMGRDHNVEKYNIKCEHCSKVCATKGAMLLHVQSLHSEMRYMCDLCDYRAGVKWMVTLHKRKHYGNKDYSCSICERCFGRASNLRTHFKVHTGSSGRVCRFCRRGFINLDCLTQHEIEFH